MRRPLADAGLIFILIILLFQLICREEYPDFGSIDGQSISVTGVLSRIEYKEKEDTIQTILYLNNISFFSGRFNDSITTKDNLICYLADSPKEIRLGMTLKIYGTFHMFEPAYNPGNFDSLKYNRIMHNIASVSNAKFEVLEDAPDTLWWKYKNALCKLRHILSGLCDICFMDNDGGIAKTMLLGDRSSLSSDIKSLYSGNGIAHILAISGLHISLIGTAIYKLLKKLRIPPILCSITVILLMITYGMLCGMAASAARAIIMFCLKMLAYLCHRTYDIHTALVTSAVLILIEQPKYIFYSGFLFSFGAIVSVIIVYPQLKELFPKFLAAGISINLTTLPLYLYSYSYYPLISLILNLYVIPLMGILLVLMIITLILGAFFLPLGKLFAIPVHLILSIYNYSCEFGNRLPIGKMVTGQPQLFQIILFYIMLTAILYLCPRFPIVLTQVLLVLSCIVLTLNLRSGVSVTCIDVGQGDSIYISDYHSFTVLVDAGSSSVTDVAKYRISPYLLSQGCACLDAVFVTHLDSDHINGLRSLIEESGISSPRIQSIVFPKSVSESDSAEYVELCKLIQNKKINLLFIQKGDSFTLGNYSFYCLYPDSDCHGKDANAESLVLLGNIGDASVLLTGDLEGYGETAVAEELSHLEFLQQQKLRILKVAHHGSSNSTFNEFLGSYRPNLALISAGRNNRYGHPHKDTLRRLTSFNTKYYSTSDYGAVTVNISRSKIKVYGYPD